MNVLILIYQDPEGYYPPTLYAIDSIAGKSEKVILVYRQFFENTWEYPKNVRKYISSQHLQGISKNENIVVKLLNFLKFYFIAVKCILKYKPSIIIAYDDIPLFALNLVPKFIRKNSVLWYHNHDVTEGSRLRKYSIQWFAWKYQHLGIRKTQFFSLPSVDRLPYFPKERPNHSYIPNFPNRRFCNTKPKDLENKVVKLVYHGNIGRGHGFEEIISVLGTSGKLHITFAIIGNIPNDYKEELIALAQSLGKSEFLSFRGRVPFSGLQEALSEYHIGVPIHKTNSIQYATGGTASNKIYEYAACGLPVLLYDNEHYRHYLGKYPWAFFTDLSPNSLVEQIEVIYSDYNALTAAAHQSFITQNNFEQYFEPVFNQVIQKTETH